MYCAVVTHRHVHGERANDTVATARVERTRYSFATARRSSDDETLAYLAARRGLARHRLRTPHGIDSLQRKSEHEPCSAGRRRRHDRGPRRARSIRTGCDRHVRSGRDGAGEQSAPHAVWRPDARRPCERRLSGRGVRLGRSEGHGTEPLRECCDVYLRTDRSSGHIRYGHSGAHHRLRLRPLRVDVEGRRQRRRRHRRSARGILRRRDGAVPRQRFGPDVLDFSALELLLERQ